MTLKINTLLNKKKWRGEEVGRALIISLVSEWAARGNPNKKPVFTQEDIDRMKAGLMSEQEGKKYNQYIDLYNGLLSLLNHQTAREQQFFHGFYRVLGSVQSAAQVEDIRDVLKKTPIIVTEKQYKETMDKVRAQHAAFVESYHDLICHALRYYSGVYTGKKPRVPKKIKEAIQALGDEPMTNKKFLAEYNSLTGRGYYETADGRRSDAMKPDEWAKVLEEEYLKRHELVVNGEKQDFETPAQEFNQARRLENLKKAFVTGEGREAEGFREARQREAQNEYGTTWREYPHPKVGDLLKRDLVEDDLETLLEYYTNYTDLDEEEDLALFEEFKADFPRLYAALREELLKYPLLAKAASFQGKQCQEKFVTWGELAQANIFNYKHLMDPDDSMNYCEYFAGQIAVPREWGSGIAVIKDGSCSGSYEAIDENGHYKDHCLSLWGEFNSVESLYANESGQKEMIAGIRKNLLEDSLRSIFAQNALIDIIAEEYKLPEVKEMKATEGVFLSKTDALNGLILLLFSRFSYNTEKQNMVKELFPLIDIEGLKPTSAAIESLREKIGNLEIFKNTYATELIEELYPPTGGEV